MAGSEYRRFEGKTALISNGASAIGKAVTLRLAQEGASVMVADADLAAAEAVAKSAGARARAIHLNVASVESWERALAETVNALQRLDVLVSIATATYAAPTAIADTTLEQFRAVTTPNLEGAFLGLRYGVVKMRELGHGGAVVNIASAFATVGLAGHAAYNATANGVRMMTKAAALSCAEAKDNIRINAVQVGPMADAPESMLMPAGLTVPLGKRGTVQDIAAATAYLASDDAGYITGYILPVDGGLLAA
ncbi:MAG: SDR family oxidoreductase [Rhodospirillaceae bacterium]|nr:SDR family oxidoreductase [Rhodospirillaceae bacterium]